MAMNRMDMAKANLRIMRAGYYPSLSLDAGWSRQQTSWNTGTGQSQSRVGYFDAGSYTQLRVHETRGNI